MKNSIFFAQNGPHYSLGTKKGTATQGTILNTGGLNIKGYKDVTTHGMQHKLTTSGTWTTTLEGSTLPYDNFNVNYITSLNQNTTYHYRSFIIVNSTTYYYGNILEITTDGPTNYLNLDTTSILFESQTLSITYTVDVSSDISGITIIKAWWITVSPLSGSNNFSFQVGADDNTSEDVRTGTILVSGGGIDRSIDVVQAGTSYSGGGGGGGDETLDSCYKYCSSTYGVTEDCMQRCLDGLYTG